MSQRSQTPGNGADVGEAEFEIEKSATSQPEIIEFPDGGFQAWLTVFGVRPLYVLAKKVHLTGLFFRHLC